MLNPRPFPFNGNLRAALRGPEPLVSTFVMIPRPEIVEMLAAAGFGAVVVDLEHGPITVSELPTLVAAARGSGIFAVARMPAGADVGQILDVGVDGVLIPHVMSAQDATAFVDAGRFPPQGGRSLNPYVRGTAYGTSTTDGLGEANERVALIAMLEGGEALSELDDICAVDGLDAVFVGPVDLSGSLGLAGQPDHPAVVDVVRDVFQRLAGYQVGAGIYAQSPQSAAQWIAAGATLVALSADVAMGVRAFGETREQLSLAMSGESTSGPMPPA